MEPVTTIIVSAIALGAAAGLQQTTEQVIKDAYNGLKQVIVAKYNQYVDLIDAMDFLAKKPQDANRREVLGRELVATGVTNDEDVINRSKDVLAAVDKSGSDIVTAIGMDIGTLKAAALEVDGVQAGRSGIGVRIEEAQIENTASFKNVGSNESLPNT